MRIDRFFEKLTEYSLYTFLIFFPVSSAMIEITFTIALFSWVFSKVAKRELPHLSYDTAFVSLLLFVILSLLSIAVSDYPIQSIRGIGKLLETVLFFMIVADTFTVDEKMRRAIAIGLVVMLVTFLDSLYQMGLGKDLLRNKPLSYVDTNLRLIGPFNNHGLLASYLVGWIPFTISFFLRAPNKTPSPLSRADGSGRPDQAADRRSTKSSSPPERGRGRGEGVTVSLGALNPTQLKGKEKFLLGLLFLAAVFSLFHTQSRAAWLCFALGLAFFAIIQRQRILLLSLLLVVALGVSILPRNMIVHPDYFGKEQSMIERVVLWKRAWHVMEARPWLGTGINTYVKSYQEFSEDESENWRVQNYYAHNSFLQIGAEVGVPALLFFLVFIILFFRNCLRAVKLSRDENHKALLKAVVTAVFMLMILGLVDTVLEPIQSGMQTWFLLGMGYAGVHLVSREHERKEIAA